MVELLLGVQRLQVEEILLEEVNVRLQEGLAKRLPTKQNGGKGTDITTNIRPARQNIIIFTPRAEQTPGSLRSFSVQQTKKRGVKSTTVLPGQGEGRNFGGNTLASLQNSCYAGSVGNGWAKPAPKRNASAAPSAGSLLLEDSAVSPGRYVRQRSEHEQNQNTRAGFVPKLSQETKVTGRCV